MRKECFIINIYNLIINSTLKTIDDSATVLVICNFKFVYFKFSKFLITFSNF